MSRSSVDRRESNRRSAYNRRVAPAITLNTTLLCININTTVRLSQCCACGKKCDRGTKLLLLIQQG